ncbi:MAG: CtsR family transcriptional regulator [Succiniclasticum sp.]|jgi:transcriptional regulator of stress and heat shock response
MMKNMADAIESFIIGQMLAASQNAVMVQRNELADRLSCAPSQISYVLSTRFTPEKGYLVESRRGSGGFIRIVRILPEEEPEQEPTVEEVLDYWFKNRMLTGREHALLQYLMGILDVPEEQKREILRQAVKKMVQAK